MLHNRRSSSYLGGDAAGLAGQQKRASALGGGAGQTGGQGTNLTGSTTQVPDSPRPASSGDYVHHQQYQQHMRKLGMGGPPGGAGPGGAGRPRSAPGMDEDDDPDMAHPTDVEVRIAELSSKIDKLTDLVVRMQQENLTK